MAAKKYYAVKEGKAPGIYETWADCKAQVHGYKGALYKSFATREEAEAYMGGGAAAREEADGALKIYVDGSYAGGAYSWGFAVYDGETLVHTASGRGESADAAKLHNVAGELEAVVHAVEWAKAQDAPQIVIHHDYSGISEWAEKRWRTNRAMTQWYAAFMEPHLSWVRFKKVAGHTGVAGNELADKLAKSALGM